MPSGSFDDTMDASPIDGLWRAAQRAQRAIVVADVVESVRLMEQDEWGVIDRWRRFVDEVATEVLPAHGGRLVKSTGDGLLLEFAEVLPAIQASFEMHRRIGRCNQGAAPASAMLLRVGAHVADVVIDQRDVYGAGVNLAARLGSLAGPGETVVSAAVHGQLVDGFDADLEDLGDCYLKHVQTTVRAYRVGTRAGPVARRLPTPEPGGRDRLSVAVIPFAPRTAAGAGGGDELLGEAVADDLIAQLSRLPQLHVISRLSTTALRHRAMAPAALGEALGAQYLVHGSCFEHDGRVRLHAELVEARDGRVLWADQCDASLRDVFLGEGEVLARLVEGLCGAMLGAEVRRACSMPLPTLESYTILLGAVALMHRLSRADFERSRAMLDYLAERHPRATAPRAWLGKWHVMRAAQGWSPDPRHDAGAARSVVGAALDLDPGNSLALAIDGLICAYIGRDLDTAGRRYDEALRANPSESLALLFRSAWHAYNDRGEAAVDTALQAQRLSPLDPLRYYYDNFTSTAMLAAGDLAGAIDYGRRSLRANRTHGPTLRILAIAQALSGQLDEARATLAEMLALEPDFTIGRFLERYPGRAAAHVPRYVGALRELGLPG